MKSRECRRKPYCGN